jgi:hypothetical protein
VTHPTNDLRVGDVPAFPLNFIPGSSVWERAGLTKRELFAAMAMQGLIARGISYSLQDAHTAVRYADAVLSALDVSKEAT